MASFLYTTDGLRAFVDKTSTPAKARKLSEVQFVACELNPITYDPVGNALLAHASEAALLSRRGQVRMMWKTEKTSLAANGVNSAQALLAQAFNNLNAIGRTISVKVVGRRDGWTSEAQPGGAKALLAQVNQFNAYLTRTDFIDGDCGKVVLAILQASRTINAPIHSLDLNLRYAYSGLNADLTAMLQATGPLETPRLPALATLTLRFEEAVDMEYDEEGGDEDETGMTGSFDPDTTDRWTLLRLIGVKASMLNKIALSWKSKMDEDEHYDLIFGHVRAALPNTALRSLTLDSARVSEDELREFFNSHAESLKALTMTKVHMLGVAGWRATLRWMAENLALDELELKGLRCTDYCTSISRYCTKVLCGLCSEGVWESHGVYQDAEAVLDALDYLADVTTGQYKWADQLRDGKWKPGADAAVIVDPVRGPEL